MVGGVESSNLRVLLHALQQIHQPLLLLLLRLERLLQIVVGVD